MAERLLTQAATTSAILVDLHQQAAPIGIQLRHTALTTEVVRVRLGAQLKHTAHQATAARRATRIALQAQAAGRQVRHTAHRAMAAHTAQVIQAIQIAASNKYK